MSHDQIINVMVDLKCSIPPEDAPDAAVLKNAIDAAGQLIGHLIDQGILAPGPNWEGE